jgi:hypothetical protein
MLGVYNVSLRAYQIVSVLVAQDFPSKNQLHLRVGWDAEVIHFLGNCKRKINEGNVTR